MRIKISKDDPLKIEKEDTLDIARDLGYSLEILLRIARAKTVIEMDRAMMYARRNEL